MTMTIRSLADLHLLRNALRIAEEVSYSDPPSNSPTEAEVNWAPVEPPLAIPDDDPGDLAELERLLKQHDLWLGYSPIKGWALLDRNHPEYKDWIRPFVLLGDGSLDRLSRIEFSKEPHGPWALEFWKRIDGTTRQESGPVTALLPEIRRYSEKAAQAAQFKTKLIADRNEDFATRIDEPPFDEKLFSTSGLEFHKEWARVRREHYARALPIRVAWLRGWAKRISEGVTGLEPTWSQGTAAGCHLSDNGIAHLWHFTNVRNLAVIRREGGLYSWAGLGALGIRDAHMMANDISRSCDVRLGRERYVRLSFIPNSWFFQRVRYSGQSVWLRFSLKALTLGEVVYSLGNAASGFVSPQGNLPAMGINWDMVTPFAAPCSDDRGPTQYRGLYEDQVGDHALFRQITNAWNSEVLIKHFLPLEFCNGVFDSRTGEPIRI